MPIRYVELLKDLQGGVFKCVRIPGRSRGIRKNFPVNRALVIPKQKPRVGRGLIGRRSRHRVAALQKTFVIRIELKYLFILNRVKIPVLVQVCLQAPQYIGFTIGTKMLLHGRRYFWIGGWRRGLEGFRRDLGDNRWDPI